MADRPRKKVIVLTSTLGKTLLKNNVISEPIKTNNTKNKCTVCKFGAPTSKTENNYIVLITKCAVCGYEHISKTSINKQQ